MKDIIFGFLGKIFDLLLPFLNKAAEIFFSKSSLGYFIFAVIFLLIWKLCDWLAKNWGSVFYSIMAGICASLAFLAYASGIASWFGII